MDEQTKEVLEQYLRQIKQEIHRFSPADEFLASLRQDLYEFAEAHPKCTREDLEAEFGTPQEIARDFLNNNPNLAPKAVVRGRWIRNVVIVVLLIALAAGAYVLHDYLSQRQTMATDVIVIEN